MTPNTPVSLPTVDFSDSTVYNGKWSGKQRSSVLYGAKTYPVKGHPFGLNLSAEDRKALIAFLKTL